MRSAHSFRITAPLKSSMRVGRHSVSLDGLLWHALSLHLGNPEKASSSLGDYLTATDGVSHASSLYFGTTIQERLIATKTPLVGMMRSGTDLAAHHFHPNSSKGTRYTKIAVNAGLTKNRVASHETYHAPYVVWFAHGDGSAICDLLNFYITNIGLEANRGLGSVGAFRMEPVSEDLSLIDSKQEPARVLPISLYKKLSGKSSFTCAKAGIAPPYRGDYAHMCAIPDRIKRIIME